MKLQKVHSSAVARMGFDHGIMTVQYTSGKTLYHYKGESRADFNKIKSAGSIGKSLAAKLGIHANK